MLRELVLAGILALFSSGKAAAKAVEDPLPKHVVQKYLGYTRTDGTRVFERGDLLELSKVPEEFVDRLYPYIKTHLPAENINRGFTSGDVRGFYSVHKRQDIFEFLNIKDKNGNSMRRMDILDEYFFDWQGSVEHARQALEYLDNDGNFLLDWSDLIELRINEGRRARQMKENEPLDNKLELSYIARIRMLNRYMGILSIAAMNNDGIPADYIESMLPFVENDAYICMIMHQAFTLGIQPEDMTFTDTPRPNALITYPAKENDTAFLVDSNKKLIKKIRKAYDMLFCPTKSEKDLYDGLDRVPDISFWATGGHGTGGTIELADQRLFVYYNAKPADRWNRYNSNDPEQFKQIEGAFLDTADNEMRKHMSNIRSDARVLALSCHAGQSREEGKNIANFISSMLPGVPVYSCTNSHTVADVKVKKAYPFRAIIIDKKHTYIAGEEPKKSWFKRLFE